MTSTEQDGRDPRRPAIPERDPIGGYGDFSAVGYHDIDWFRVTELTVQCANDQGIAARLIPPGDGISLSDVPTGQHLNARSVLNACRAGLQLPPPEPPTREVIEAEYAHQLEVAECLRGEGYAIPEASSLDAFIEGYATGEIWLPYNYVQTASPTEWERLQVACPQSRRPGG